LSSAEDLSDGSVAANQFREAALQSSGVLLAVDLARLRVQAASANAGELIGKPVDDLIGQSIASIFGKAESDRLKSVEDDDLPPGSLRPRRLQTRHEDGNGREIDCLAHRSGDFVLLELFDPQETALDSPDARARFRDIIFADVDSADSIPDLCQRTADRLRDSMGLNGVGIYGFDPAGNGQIVCVSNDGVYNFPSDGIRASRLPDAVRRPLERTRIRLVSNFGNEGVSVVTAPDSVGQIDLSSALLRAFSAEDEAYLADFVPAKGFLVMPIIVDKRLWGVVMCLNTEEFRPPLVDLRLYSFATQVLTSGVARLEASGRLFAFRNARNIADKLESHASESLTMVETIEEVGEDLLDTFGFEQALLRIDGKQTGIGVQDGAESDLTNLREWAENGIAIIDSKSPKEALVALSDNPNTEAAYLSLSDDGSDYLFLGRRDYGLNYLRGRSGKKLQSWRPLSTTTEMDALQPLRRSLMALLNAERARYLTAENLRAETTSARLRSEMLNLDRNTTLSELAGSLAHEMNQPLTAISNFVGACKVELENSGLDVPQGILELMDDTVEEAARAGALLSRLRRFVETGETVRVALDLNEVVQHAAILAHETVLADDVSLEFRLDDFLPEVHADRMQIEQVVFNLVRNAIQVLDGEDRGKVVVTTGTDKTGKVRTTIADSGPGVPKSSENYLFQPLQPGSGGGMGMGLSICRKIVEAHGGRIDYTRNDNWTEFSFILPVHNEKPENA
tara:strand:+ start:2235 stop:4448 length:2214 start_codon:yes stop_codon:yes gene_type:complete